MNLLTDIICTFALLGMMAFALVVWLGWLGLTGYIMLGIL